MEGLKLPLKTLEDSQGQDWLDITTTSLRLCDLVGAGAELAQQQCPSLTGGERTAHEGDQPQSLHNTWGRLCKRHAEEWWTGQDSKAKFFVMIYFFKDQGKYLN